MLGINIGFIRLRGGGMALALKKETPLALGQLSMLHCG